MHAAIKVVNNYAWKGLFRERQAQENTPEFGKKWFRASTELQMWKLQGVLILIWAPALQKSLN